MFKILFVCTGNTCRSPMAEFLLRDFLEEEGIADISIQSAGISTMDGMEASQKAVTALQELGIDLQSHRSKRLDGGLLAEADLILTMTREHRDFILKNREVKEKNIYTLKEFVGLKDNKDIVDPYGRTIKDYRQTRDEISDSLQKLIVKLDQSKFKAGKKEKTENSIKGRDDKVMKVAIGADHAGYEMKKEIIDYFRQEGIDYQDLGTDSEDSVDYPDFAYKVAAGVATGDYDRGILICGTGIGMSIAANKVKDVRAALCHDVFSARSTRNHNNTNVLTMGARVIGNGLALEIVKVWLAEKFDGGRHQRRINKVQQIERGEF